MIVLHLACFKQKKIVIIIDCIVFLFLSNLYIYTFKDHASHTSTSRSRSVHHALYHPGLFLSPKEVFPTLR